MRKRKSFAKNSDKWFLKIVSVIENNIIESREIQFEGPVGAADISTAMEGSNIEKHLKENYGIDISSVKFIYSDRIVRYKYFFKNKLHKDLLLQFSFDDVLVSGNGRERRFYELDISSEPFYDHKYIFRVINNLRKRYLNLDKKNFTSINEDKYSYGLELLWSNMLNKAKQVVGDNKL